MSAIVTVYAIHWGIKFEGDIQIRLLNPSGNVIWDGWTPENMTKAEAEQGVRANGLVPSDKSIIHIGNNVPEK